ncbi:MAG: dihydroxyacetone kinase subunit DhaK [Sphaerochaetaceae bacterium]|jgi:dihydroxyacetone kinase-like protein
MMKKFMNKPEDLTKELLEGLAMANEEIIELVDGHLVVNKKLKDADRVTVVTLGGTGHEPALQGFVGEGMVDIAVCGDIFAAPGPESCLKALEMADKGKGVLFVVLNHAGDMLTAKLTMKEAKAKNLNVIKVVTQEDITTAPRDDADNRRGFVGCVPVYKIAGGAARQGKTLEEVAAIAQKFADNMGAISVSLTGATHPVTGGSLAVLEDDEMGVGMGQHGEGGGYKIPMKTSAETVALLMEKLLKDLDVKKGERLMCIVNGCGATTLMEMLITYRDSVLYLKERGIEVVANMVGEILTVQETGGYQLFIARMDDEFLSYWDEYSYTPYYKS